MDLNNLELDGLEFNRDAFESLLGLNVFILANDDAILYVGISSGTQKFNISPLNKGDGIPEKALKEYTSVFIFPAKTVYKAIELEEALIIRFKPLYNIKNIYPDYKPTEKSD